MQTNENVRDDKCKRDWDGNDCKLQADKGLFSFILCSSVYLEDNMNILISLVFPPWKKKSKYVLFIPRTEKVNAHIFILNELPTFYSLVSQKSWNLAEVSELN